MSRFTGSHEWVKGFIFAVEQCEMSGSITGSGVIDGKSFVDFEDGDENGEDDYSDEDRYNEDLIPGGWGEANG
jgi:hypothetical protein